MEVGGNVFRGLGWEKGPRPKAWLLQLQTMTLAHKNNYLKKKDLSSSIDLFVWCDGGALK